MYKTKYLKFKNNILRNILLAFIFIFISTSILKCFQNIKIEKTNCICNNIKSYWYLFMEKEKSECISYPILRYPSYRKNRPSSFMNIWIAFTVQSGEIYYNTKYVPVLDIWYLYNNFYFYCILICTYDLKSIECSMFIYLFYKTQKKKQYLRHFR